MITSDAELEVVRKQLTRVEAALDSLRRDVRPKSEKMYELMAESSIDLLHALRAEINAYLGIGPIPGDRKYTDAEGVIRGVDLDSQTFVLRERPGGLPDLPCEYSIEIEDVVKGLLDCRVSVSGTLETSRTTRKEKMEAEAIQAVTVEEESRRRLPAGEVDSVSK